MPITKKSRKNKIEYADPIIEIETRDETPEVEVKAAPLKNKTAVIPTDVDWISLFSIKVLNTGFNEKEMTKIGGWETGYDKPMYNYSFKRFVKYGFANVTTNIPEAINRIKEYYGEHPDKILFKRIEVFKDGELWDVDIKDADECFCYNNAPEMTEEPRFSEKAKAWFDTEREISVSYCTKVCRIDKRGNTTPEFDTVTISTDDDEMKRRIKAYADEYANRVTFVKRYTSDRKPGQIGWVVKIKSTDFVTRRI